MKRKVKAKPTRRKAKPSKAKAVTRRRRRQHTHTLMCGDSRILLRTMSPNSIDSAVTDPPYALTSIVKRFGKKNSAPAKGNAAFIRTSRGFMGQTWDNADAVHDPKFWLEVYRVLKPGAYLIAFGGTRTYHRMVCAIEDAGFEIRDMVQWLYGSGFPKSHDVSKGIDKCSNRVGWFGAWLRKHRESIGLSQKELARRGKFYKNVNHGGLIANWELGYGTPTTKQFNTVCKLLNLPFRPMAEVEREVIGSRKINAGVAFSSSGPTSMDITTPATNAARDWSGWGTALKPANEPIVLARKPLSEKTVAANVLKWGTGAINVDGCRVENRERTEYGLATATRSKGNVYGKPSARANFNAAQGRWPANVITDGSDEVVGMFPDTRGRGNLKPTTQGGGSGNSWSTKIRAADFGSSDSGSAARFFYQAKATKKDRAGSKHPTVKPIALIQYLCRMVTPIGGIVLDPFAGTGTLAAAAQAEGFRSIMIENEKRFQRDIKRRVKKLKVETLRSIKAELRRAEIHVRLRQS